MVINQKRSISYNGIEIDRNELNLIIHRLLCELNQNGSKVNEYSAKKSKLIQQLQSDIDGMNGKRWIKLISNEIFQIDYEFFGPFFIFSRKKRDKLE